MANIKGMLTLEILKKLVRGDEIDTVLTVFTDHYGRFMGKRFDAGLFPGRDCKSRHSRM